MASIVAYQVLRKMNDLGSVQSSYLLSRAQVELSELKEFVFAALYDAEQKQAYSNRARHWLEMVSGVMYDVDDLLDDLFSKARASAMKDDCEMTTCWSAACFLVTSIPRAWLYDIHLARRFEAVNAKLERFRNELHGSGLQVVSWGHPPPVALLRREPDQTVIGRQADKEAIIKLLDLDSEAAGISVVSIVGRGLLGKTTLARLVSEDEQVKIQFGTIVWVDVSTSFKAKEILAKMLLSITGQNHAGLRLADLEVMLQEKIGGPPFLLVLDDVWEEGVKFWRELRQHLMKVGGAAGSKILVTTRSTKVAEIAGQAMMEAGARTSMVARLYFLAGLTEDESVQFLMSKTLLLHGVHAENELYEEMVRKIAEICRGVPLAIREMATLLCLTRKATDWPEILGSLQSSYRREDDTMPVVLRLCFNSIPSHLRLCLSYCSVFPSGHVFDIQSLAQVWEAQGYIDQFGEKGSGGMRGLQCFEMLRRRSFFHDIEMDEFGNLATCRMENWVYDLASMGDTVRHLMLPPYPESSSQFPTDIDPKLLRSVLLGGHESSSSSTTSRTGWSMLKPLLPSLKSLRALDVHSSGIEQVPSSIRDLTYLRYLDVSGNDAIEQLPESISELWHLQVLKLSGCTRLKQLPSNIRKLVNLMHLYCEGCSNLTHMPCGIGELTSLLTLTCFVLPKHIYPSKHMAAGLSELGSLKHLTGRLEIRNLGVHNGGGTSFLREKLGLQSLRLCWDMDDGANADVTQQHQQTLECCEPPPGLKELEVSEYGGEEFPSWLSSLRDLIRIKILDCPRCRSLPPLDEFPCLRSCTIDSLPKLEHVSSWSGRMHDSPLFPSLKELYLSNCPSLKGWWEADADVTFPSFHCLSRLEIRDCLKLDRMPLFPTLEEKLLLEYSSLAPLQLTMQHQESVSSSSSSRSLSRLKSLWLLSIEERQVLPEQWLQKLSSLQELLIEFCPKLSFLPPGMRRMASLRVFDVHRCPQLTQRCGSNKAVDWPNIAHIPNVRVDKKLIQLGGKYQLTEEESTAAIANFSLVHPLSKITSVTVESLESLPAEWVRNLSTLKKLKIVNSPGVQSLPQELCSVTLLERLLISGSPTLEEMCVEDEGCAAIAHVPFVLAGDRVIRPKPC